MYNTNNIDELRKYYLQKAPYPYDRFIEHGAFTSDELAAIQKYGWWFEAIWNNKVPLNTKKLKSFHSARKKNRSERTKWEDLWVRYDQERCPF